MITQLSSLSIWKNYLNCFILLVLLFEIFGFSKKIWYVCNILVFFGCSTQLKSDFPKNDTEQFDIVFVSIDTLPFDHSSTVVMKEIHLHSLILWPKMGYGLNTLALHLLDIAAHTTMFTGQVPATHHIVDDTVSLDPSTPVLPAILQDSGYQTGGFVSTLYVSKSLV